MDLICSFSLRPRQQRLADDRIWGCDMWPRCHTWLGWTKPKFKRVQRDCHSKTSKDNGKAEGGRDIFQQKYSKAKKITHTWKRNSTYLELVIKQKICTHDRKNVSIYVKCTHINIWNTHMHIQPCRGWHLFYAYLQCLFNTVIIHCQHEFVGEEIIYNRQRGEADIINNWPESMPSVSYTQMTLMAVYSLGKIRKPFDVGLGFSRETLFSVPLRPTYVSSVDPLIFLRHSFLVGVVGCLLVCCWFVWCFYSHKQEVDDNRKETEDTTVLIQKVRVVGTKTDVSNNELVNYL